MGRRGSRCNRLRPAPAAARPVQVSELSRELPERWTAGRICQEFGLSRWNHRPSHRPGGTDSKLLD
jgi:hypothetical protein